MGAQKMARLIVLFALCVLPALVSARFIGKSYEVHGQVYCDTCRAGFETEVTRPISGAKVRIECKNRNTMQLTYSVEATTDSKGAYKAKVIRDCGDDICDAVLVESPQPDCSEVDPGRDRSRVPLTDNNGVISKTRYANALGFLMAQPMSGCTQVLQKYIESDDV